MKYTKVLLLSLFLMALSTVGCFAEPVIYTYTGNPYTTALPPYSTSDFISVSITLAEPLGPNVLEWDGTPASSPIPLEWSVSDGIQTLTDVSAELDVGFGTDGSGNIVTWVVSYYPYPLGFTRPYLFTTFGDIYSNFDESNDEIINGSYARNNNDPGTWTISEPVSGLTPEPYSLWLLATGALGAGLVRIRRRAGQEISCSPVAP